MVDDTELVNQLLDICNDVHDLAQKIKEHGDNGYYITEEEIKDALELLHYKDAPDDNFNRAYNKGIFSLLIELVGKEPSEFLDETKNTVDKTERSSEHVRRFDSPVVSINGSIHEKGNGCEGCAENCIDLTEPLFVKVGSDEGAYDLLNGLQVRPDWSVPSDIEGNKYDPSSIKGFILWPKESLFQPMLSYISRKVVECDQEVVYGNCKDQLQRYLKYCF